MTTNYDSLIASLFSTISAQQAELIEFQHYLHAHPELSNAEFLTTQLIAQKMTALGFEVRVRPQGVGLIADLAPQKSRGMSDNLPVIAIRADIDALPIQEETSLPYASTTPQVMHACGHDIHTAAAYAAAVAFAAISEQLPFPVRFIFQHAEEITAHGAFEMIDFGALEGVREIFALHADPSRPLNTIGLRDGALTASYDAFTITIHGNPGHGARPHEAIDTIYVMTQVASALYNLIGRYFDARDPAVMSIGTFHAGQAANAIPPSGSLSGTIRTLSNEHRALIQPLIRRTVDNICAAHGASATIDIEVGSPSVINSRHATHCVRQAAIALLGINNIDEIELPSMGSEDFSHYLQHVPGTMFRLGVISDNAPFDHLHSNTFVADSRSLLVGGKILGAAALHSMRDLEVGKGSDS